MTENELPTGGERPTGERDEGARPSGPEHRTDRIDPTATGVDVGRIEHEPADVGTGVHPVRRQGAGQLRHSATHRA